MGNLESVTYEEKTLNYYNQKTDDDRITDYIFVTVGTWFEKIQ